MCFCWTRGKGKRERGRKEEGRRKKEEGRRKKEEGRRREEGGGDRRETLTILYRGTGKSTPINHEVLNYFETDRERADYLSLFRQDSIVRDCEVIREKVLFSFSFFLSLSPTLLTPFLTPACRPRPKMGPVRPKFWWFLYPHLPFFLPPLCFSCSLHWGGGPCFEDP